LGAAEPTWGELVTGNYFAVLGLKPEVGRFFTMEEDGNRPGAYPVVVISDTYWRREFQADPRICGKTLKVNQRTLTIVGVAPRRFRGTMPGLVFDLWIPATMTRELAMLSDDVFTDRGARSFYGLGRLAPGYSLTAARTEAAALANGLAKTYPTTNEKVSAAVVPLWELPSAGPELLQGPIRILSASSVLLLLIVCANVANLLLARALARRRELGIRLAMGAAGIRLARQLLTESLLLAAAAGALGLLITTWVSGSMAAMVPNINAPLATSYELDGRALAFTAIVCVVTALLSGAIPAMISLKTDVIESLKAAGGGGQGVGTHRLRDLLVVAEVALATLTLAGAGLFFRSFRTALSMDPGFDRKNVTLARIHVAGTGMTAADKQQFFRRVRDSVRHTPRIEDVTYADDAPLGSSSGSYREIEVEGYTPKRGEPVSVNRYTVATGFFKTLRIPILQGRDFTERDEGKAEPVMIVNQAFADRYWHSANPVGRRVRIGRTWITVVGMVKNSKYFSIAEAPRPHFFTPIREGWSPWDGFLMVRSEAPLKQIAAQLRHDIPAADGRVCAYDLMPLQAWTEVTLLPQKAAASMAGALGLISLLLAAVGLYSVMAYAVAQRTREIGIRMALGAMPRNVLADVLARGMALTFAGLVLGIVCALLGGRLVAHMLIGVAPSDPAALAGTAMFLSAIAFVATYIPARRATRIQPTLALRCEQ